MKVFAEIPAKYRQPKRLSHGLRHIFVVLAAYSFFIDIAYLIFD